MSRSSEDNNRISDDELVSHYIFINSEVKRNKVHHKALMPPRPRGENKNVELSVTCHSGLSEGDLWQYGLNIMKLNGCEKLVGRAVLQVGCIRAIDLDVVSDPITSDNILAVNENHANIVKWTNEVSLHKKFARKLAELAKFEPYKQ